MSEQKNQMPVRYKCLADGENAGYRLENSLDKILLPGCYIVEVDHKSGSLGLPVSFCGEEHYLVGTLIVTDSGTAGPLQKNRVAGQVLTFTSRKNKDTVIYVRTYADGKWGEWHSLVRTGMYDNITSTDELVASVTQLVTETKEIEADLALEITRATDAEHMLAADFQEKIDSVEGNVHKAIINYNAWKVTDDELSLPNVLADNEFVKLVTCGTILTYKNTSTTWKRFQYVSENVSPEYVKSYSNWRELSATILAIKQEVDANKVQISTTGENGNVKDSINIVAATTTNAGVMTAADKKKLDDSVNALAAEVTRAKAAEAAAIDEGRKLALRSLFIAAGAMYNDTASDIERTAPWGETVSHKVGHYYLNGLGDITENEMMNIYNESNNYILSENIACFFFQSKIRTNICKKGTGWSENIPCVTKSILAFYNSKMEVALIVNPSWPSDDVYCFQAGDISSMFDFCTSLKRVVGVINVTASTSGLKSAFSRCSALLSVKIKGLNQNIILKDSPNVEKDCIMYMVENANVSTAITITLHADAYARLADDTDIIALLETQPLVSLVSA